MNSASATSTDPTVAGWVTALLQASDTFYPTGSYAHSFGLEGLVSEGVVRDRETLRDFLIGSVLPSLERAELPLVLHASTALRAHDWPLVRQLSFLASALRASAEIRRASENIGRQRAELAAALRPGTLAVAYLERAQAGDWPFSAGVSAAVEGAAIGAPIDAVAAGYAYASIAALLAAAMKLLRLGQNGAQSLLTETLAHLPNLVASAKTIPVSDIGWFNPWLDIAAARHETADARMFIS